VAESILVHRNLRRENGKLHLASGSGTGDGDGVPDGAKARRGRRKAVNFLFQPVYVQEQDDKKDKGVQLIFGSHEPVRASDVFTFLTTQLTKTKAETIVILSGAHGASPNEQGHSADMLSLIAVNDQHKQKYSSILGERKFFSEDQVTKSLMEKNKKNWGQEEPMTPVEGIAGVPVNHKVYVIDVVQLMEEFIEKKTKPEKFIVALKKYLDDVQCTVLLPAWCYSGMSKMVEALAKLEGMTVTGAHRY